jgi:hypothetical protein
MGYMYHTGCHSTPRGCGVTRFFMWAILPVIK